MTSRSDDPTPSRDTGRRWTIPADHQWVIGREGGAANIGLQGTQLDKHATVRWTGRAVEIRAAGTQDRPVVDGQPVVHARVPVGGAFAIANQTFRVVGPAEIELITTHTPQRPMAQPADWYNDPDGSGGQRWWDGQGWTTRRPVSQPPPSGSAPAPILRPQPPVIPAAGPHITQPPVGPGWYPDPAGSGGQRYWDGHHWSAPQAPSQGNYWRGKPGMTQRLSQRSGEPWLQSIKDTGPGRVERGSSRWVAGLAIIAAGGALVVSTLLAWGHTTASGYAISMSGLGQVSVEATRGRGKHRGLSRKPATGRGRGFCP